MLLLALAIQALFSPASPAAAESHDILKENSSLTCVHHDDSRYGFLFERGAGVQVRVSIITRGENEGEKSAFTAELKASNDDMLYLRFDGRVREFGRVVQFALGKKANLELGPKLPGLFVETSIHYEKDEASGLEIPQVLGAGSFQLQCDFPETP